MPSNTALVTGFVVIAMATFALVLALSQSDANENGLLIAIFPPTASERSIMVAITAAGGSHVRASLPRTIVVAHSQHAGFAQALKAQGALMTFGQAPFGPELAGCLALATVPYEPVSTELTRR